MSPSRAQRRLLEKAADHPDGRITGGIGIARLALVNAGLIKEDGQLYSSGGCQPLYKITAKGRAVVRGGSAPRGRSTTKPGELTRVISIGIMAPAAATVRVSKDGGTWKIIEVINVIASDVTPRTITRYADDVHDVGRLAELAEDE